MDHRRKNRCNESLQVRPGAIHTRNYLLVRDRIGLELLCITFFNSPLFFQENAKRLKAYKAKLIVFPRRTGKPKVRSRKKY